MLKSTRSRLWGSTRMRMVQLASSRSTTAWVRFLRRTQRRVVPSELTRMCLASPRRVGWVTAGKGQRRASSRADDGVTTRTKTFVIFSFDPFRWPKPKQNATAFRDRISRNCMVKSFFCINRPRCRLSLPKLNHLLLLFIDFAVGVAVFTSRLRVLLVGRSR